MSSIDSSSFTRIDPSSWNQSAINRIRYGNLSDASTGLNPKGNTAFRNRMTELLKENGISGDISFGRNGEGKFILLQAHEDKEKIENLLNSDEQLRQILDDPANTYDLSKGGLFYTNGYDSAHFSEQAKKMYEEREKNGQAAFASSAEDTAKVMEWDANRQTKLVLAPGQKLETNSNMLMVSQSDSWGNVDPASLRFAKTDAVKDLANARNWLETEITSLLDKAGIDTSKLSGVIFSPSGNGIGVQVNQKGMSEKDRQTIESILNNPENEQVAKIFKRYWGEVNGVANDLKRATGLNDTDWAEIMASGGDLASVDNDGMKALLANDPELAGALNSLFNGGSGFLASTYSVSSREEAKKAIGGLGGAIDSLVKGLQAGGDIGAGLSSREIADLKKNLSVEGQSDGAYKVGGTKNSKLLSVIGEYVAHYLSGPFADGLKAGGLLNQALGLGKADDNVSFMFNYLNDKPNATMQYGDGKQQKV